VADCAVQKVSGGHGAHWAVVGPVVAPKVPGEHTQSRKDEPPVTPMVLVPTGHGNWVELVQ
jgi:hypothetical protein